MTRDEIVSAVLGRCVRSGDTTLQASAETELRILVEQELERGATLPWFLLSEFLTATTVIGEERVPLPTNVGGVTGRDFLREHETCSLWILPESATKYVELVKDDYDAIYNELGGGSDSYGQPTKYSLDNQYFYLKPTPDKAYSLRMRVYLREPRLSSNIENGWTKNAGDLLIARLGIVIAGQYIRDAEALANFTAARQTAEDALWRAHEAREHAGRSYSMGDD